MTTPHNEVRPRRTEGDDVNLIGWRAASESTDLTAALARADYALLVVSGLRNGGTRRSFYFSLPSALKALDRAASRGVVASITLVKFTPAGHLDLHDLGVRRDEDLDVQLGGGAR